jgi:hypothetical protein
MIAAVQHTHAPDIECAPDADAQRRGPTPSASTKTYFLGSVLAVSLQSIATKTGLSKSTVQAAIRHLRRRRLLDPAVSATVTDPARHILWPWIRS